MTRVRAMMMFVACALSASLMAQDKKPEEKLDPAKLVGEWKITEGMKSGEKSDPEKLKAGKVIIAKDKITFKDGDTTFVFSYKVNLDKKPVEIDLTGVDPDFIKDAKALGILKLDGGKLTLCYNSTPGGKRPEKFESPKESGIFMFVHEKAEVKK